MSLPLLSENSHFGGSQTAWQLWNQRFFEYSLFDKTSNLPGLFSQSLSPSPLFCFVFVYLFFSRDASRIPCKCSRIFTFMKMAAISDQRRRRKALEKDGCTEYPTRVHRFRPVQHGLIELCQHCTVPPYIIGWHGDRAVRSDWSVYNCYAFGWLVGSWERSTLPQK